MWTMSIAGLAMAGVYLSQVLAGMRGQMKRGLEQAERITTRQRQALEETERALEQARQTL